MSEYGRIARPEPCVMELVSKLAREPWTDRPSCVHPTLSAAARAVHDHSSPAGRRALLPLAPRFIDTARPGVQVSARVVALCVSTALATGEESVRLRKAHETALHLLTGEGEGRWWLRHRWSESFYRTFVAPEQVAESIAVAAHRVNDRELRTLLKQCLAAHGALRPGAPTPS
ncbi:hypothetical protein ABZS29_17460 [Kribbella sp. NPDC005582]|uniref:hypothetical protein n=1 Tax=Kribbella sp. NPDC005582 TaxID=3156893 RepID=UPI0033A4B963